MKSILNSRNGLGMRWSYTRRRTWGWGLQLVAASRNNGV